MRPARERRLMYGKLPPIPEVPKDQHDGYHVVVAGSPVVSSWCEDCHRGTCECLLDMAAAARDRGPGANVHGPLGRVLIKREAA